MRVVGRLAFVMVLAGLVLALGLLALAPQGRALFTAGSGRTTSVDDLGVLLQRSVVYAADGSVLAVLHAEQNRQPVGLASVPPILVHAIVDIEDARFYEHHGVDIRGTLRALYTHVEAGTVEQGGSTITQQLVKTSLLGSKRDASRKVKEAALAVRLEHKLSKGQILERYLNTVYFGNGAYGVQAAAERYYGAKVGALTTGQAALLAGLIRNPVFYDPFHYAKAATDRRAEVVDRMHQLGDLSAAEAASIKQEPLPAKPADQATEHLDYLV